ncbi:pullulanase [bacterium]|nr:pullulanase [bacterium]
MIIYAKIQHSDLIEVCVQNGHNLSIQDFSIVPDLRILELKQEGDVYYLTTENCDLTSAYQLKVKGAGEKSIEPDGILDGFFSSKSLGHTVNGTLHYFRLFAPRAKWVSLVLFSSIRDHCDHQIRMHRDEDGVWETSLDNLGDWKYYGYRLDGPDDETEIFDPSVVIADPFSRAVTTLNHFLHPSKSLLYPPEKFDWEDDAWIAVPMADLIIYELHVRDMTMHASSGVHADLKGSYLGMIDKEGTGGISHLLKLGVNCVELMPIQEFGNIEVDYRNEHLDVYNDWNAYERNHWGYMTTFFFAPESYYATGSSMTPHEVNGQDGRAVAELKTMIREFHRHGIAVIMDVVYNHVSQYDQNPFKFIDKKYYFRLDQDQNFLSESGCGNDFKTERPMVRNLIVESLIYWMTEYHVDGFRFDLAPLIDSGTLSMLTKALRELNPDVILIAEPWGGGRYDLSGFSRLGWGAWNDLFRNHIKGQNPFNGLGLIFGYFWNNQNITYIYNLISGSLQKGGGPFREVGHAVNYLESHDDHSLGDFIRIGLHEVDPKQPVKDMAAHILLSEKQMRANKLAALCLFSSMGAVMIHAGQEFGRSKVIAQSGKPGTNPGFIDHNSYNKDDETNWINYKHMEANRDLVDYYAGLIRIRRKYLNLKTLKRTAPRFLQSPNPLLLAYKLDCIQDRQILFLINCHPDESVTVSLHEGPWQVLADERKAQDTPLRRLNSGTVTVQSCTGMILMRNQLL